MNYTEKYIKKTNGTIELVSKVEMAEISNEELITEKEAELLAMYKELEVLKQK